MSPLRLDLDLESALALFLAFEKVGDELEQEARDVEKRLRDYLYEHLSIADMENPRLLYRDLKAGRGRGLQAGGGRR